MRHLAPKRSGSPPARASGHNPARDGPCREARRQGQAGQLTRLQLVQAAAIDPPRLPQGPLLRVEGLPERTQPIGGDGRGAEDLGTRQQHQPAVGGSGIARVEHKAKRHATAPSSAHVGAEKRGGRPPAPGGTRDAASGRGSPRPPRAPPPEAGPPRPANRRPTPRGRGRSAARRRAWGGSHSRPRPPPPLCRGGGGDRAAPAARRQAPPPAPPTLPVGG